MGRIGIVAVLIASLAISGCAAVALTAGGIAGGTATDHTLSGIAYKTFNAPLMDVRRAAKGAFVRMAITLQNDEHDKDGWKIAGSASERKIFIELEKLTPKMTQMRVVVDKGQFFFKDSATGTEIIIQTVEVLNTQMARKSRRRKK